MTLNLDEEAKLAKQIPRGDPETFRILHRLYANRVMGFCLHRCDSRADAEDLVQEVFVAAYRGRQTFQAKSKIITWLLGIAVRRLRDKHRQHSVSTVEMSDDDSENLSTQDPNASDSIERVVVDSIAVDCALKRLDPLLREALLLVASQGLTYREAAQVTDVPVGTAKWRVWEANRRMRQLLASEGMEENNDRLHPVR